VIDITRVRDAQKPTDEEVRSSRVTPLSLCVSLLCVSLFLSLSVLPSVHGGGASAARLLCCTYAWLEIDHHRRSRFVIAGGTSRCHSIIVLSTYVRLGWVSLPIRILYLPLYLHLPSSLTRLLASLLLSTVPFCHLPTFLPSYSIYVSFASSFRCAHYWAFSPRSQPTCGGLDFLRKEYRAPIPLQPHVPSMCVSCRTVT